MKLAFGLAALVTVAGCAANAGAPAEQARRLTIDHLIDIRHPSDPVWSPDGTRVVFTWDRAGISNLYVADTTQPGSEPKPLTSFESGFPTGAFWSRDGQRVYFARTGDLWQVPAGGGTAAPLWTSPPPESGFALAPDNMRTAFVRPSASPRSGMDLVLRSTSDGSETVVAHDDISITGINWAPDGAHLSYSVGAKSIRHEQTPEYSGAKII